MKVLALAGALLFCGCNGQVASSGFTFGDTDAGADGGNCPTSNVWEHTSNAWVLTRPEVNIVFWGNWTSSRAKAQEASAIGSAWNILANDPNFYLPLAQYGIGNGSLVGIYNANPNAPSGEITEDYVQKELQSEIGSVLPASDNNSIYVIMLPSGTQSKYDIDNKFNGHHSFINTFTYAEIEFDKNYVGMDITASHEIYESSTNPDTSNGWWGPGGETEIGDFCEGNFYLLDGYKIQTAWSQASCECIPQADSDADTVSVSDLTQ